jgi:hypothetical protein
VTRRRSLRLFAAALALGSAQAAAAQPDRAAPEPQTPRFRVDLPPAPPDRGPPPGPEPDELARRQWEVSGGLGVALPVCHGDPMGISGCWGTAPGGGLGLGALWRVAPYVAVGVEGSLSRFSVAAGGDAGWARSSWLGTVVRGYFLEHGLLDPYVQAGLGRGSIDTTYEQGGVATRVGGAGLSTMVGAGLDFWLSRGVKLGPEIAYRWTFVRDVRACTASMCSVYAVDTAGAAASSASVGVSVAVLLGPEM